MAPRSCATHCRVGIGVVVLRNFDNSDTTEVLLIRRAKQPSKGLLCFPGGRLEWGETLAECAAREVREETGVRVQLQSKESEGQLDADEIERTVHGDLQHPRPLTTLDGLFRGDEGQLAYHYVLVEMLAAAEHDSPEPQAADDALDAHWARADGVQAVECEAGIAAVLRLALRSVRGG